MSDSWSQNFLYKFIGTNVSIFFTEDGIFGKVTLFSNHCSSNRSINLYEPVGEKLLFNQLKVTLAIRLIIYI